MDDDEMWDEDAAWMDQDMIADDVFDMNDADMDSSAFGSIEGNGSGYSSTASDEPEFQEEGSITDSTENEDSSADNY